MLAAPSPRAEAMARTFASAFAALDDLKAKEPGAANDIAVTAQAHLRSSFPSVLLVDTGPTPKLDAAEVLPYLAIERPIGNGSYRVSIDADHVVLMIHEDGLSCCAVMTSDETSALIGDLAAVKAGIGVAR